MRYFIKMSLQQKATLRLALCSFSRFNSGHEDWIGTSPMFCKTSLENFTIINSIWYKMRPLLDTINIDVVGIISNISKMDDGAVLDTDELNIITRALDFYVRVNIGQLEILAEQPASMMNSDRTEIQELACSIKRILGFSRYGNHGIHHELCKDAQKAYDILCVIRHRLMTDNNIHYRSNWEPTHVYKEWALPVIYYEGN